MELGVLSMLELKPNELLVGSGDGSVSLVLDKSGLVAHPKRKPDGITKQLNEPTTSCLQEVTPAFFKDFMIWRECGFVGRHSVQFCKKNGQPNFFKQKI